MKLVEGGIDLRLRDHAAHLDDELDWEHLDGREKGAKTIGTLTGKMLSDVVNRVAIIAEEKWRGEEERIADVVVSGADRRFATPTVARIVERHLCLC